MPQARRSRRGRVLGAVAGVVGAATLIGLAVISTGYDERELPKIETSVWVSRDSGRYARVNTTLGEIDTVRSVQDPSTIVQAGADGVVFGQGFGSLWPIDAAVPADLVGTDEGAADSADDDADAATDDSAGGDAAADGDPAAIADGDAPLPAPGDPVTATPESTPESTPPGTRAVVVAGDRLLLLTDLGEVFLGSVAASSAGDAGFAPIDPFAAEPVAEDGTRATYSASAATVAADGSVVMFSADEGAIRRYDADRGAFVGGPVALDETPGTAAALSLTIVGERWAMLQPSSGRLWIEGSAAPVSIDVDAGALLQRSGPNRGIVAIADEAGLAEFSLDDGSLVRRIAASGEPARPTPVGDDLVAAWLQVGSGSMWSSATDAVTPLQTESDVLAELDELVPVIRSNGDRAVLNETASGMLWTIPDGTLIPTSAWTIDEDDDTETGSVVIDDATEQEPPVAVPDAFGVRAGSMVSLPLLFNDSDPNRDDVLTIATDGFGQAMDPAFGALALVGSDQTATILVGATSGSSTFEYRATDGVAVSAPASVTVTVVPPEVNTAPVWCGVQDCTQTWPTPELAPGGSIVVPVLEGWVDPEGDPFVLSDVEVLAGGDSIVAVATGNGRVAIRHVDPNGAPGEVVVLLTITDALGAVAQRELAVRVSADPTLLVQPSVIVAAAGESVRLRLADVVTGGSGSIRLTEAVDASAVEGAVSVIPNAADGAIELSAQAPGEYTVAFTVLDTVTSAERTASARFRVHPVGSTIAVPPLTAFVRPGEDSTVGILEAVQNATGRVLVVASAVSDRPELSAAVVDQSTVRVRGATADGIPGPIGTVSVLVTDGAGTSAQGRITVFLAPVERDVSPIALPDSVTVRAGAQVDIPVLANDVASRGELLTVHPSVVGSGTEGELAFAAGTLVRYLAPEVPGVYTIGYTAFAQSSPDLLASSTVTVTVLAQGANRPPQPRVLTARVVAGAAVQIPVPSIGVDPDGDAVMLINVDQPSAGLGSASISAGGAAIVYRAPASGVVGGQVSFDYTLRDADGATASGVVRVGVIDDDLADLTPVTFSNHIRAQAAATEPTVVLPLADDRDPAQGTLELVSVEPNVAGGPGDPEYDRLAALVTAATDVSAGTVSLLPGDVTGTHSYIYTVRSSTSTSTAEGLIVVTVARTSAPDAPVILDTVVGIADRHRVAGGIDVLTGRVQWASGDASTLELSVWGDAASRFSASGSRISGQLPEAGALVPFELSGVDIDGVEVVSYGFLRIPALDDMRVQPSADFGPLTVNEDTSVRFDPADAVAVGPDDEIEVDSSGAFVVQRAAATCRVSGDEIVYAAGREAPWTDSCAFRVRVVGQQSWTVVAVPIEIVPDEPSAILQSVGRTIAPGATDTVDLYSDMTSWESGRVGDRTALVYDVVHTGVAFILTRDGDRLLAQATAAAVPGTKETVRVAVAAFGGLSATVTLTVGAAPVDAPRGAGVSSVCTVTESSCSVTVTGVGGEYDPFAGKPGAGLKVVGVGDAAASSASCEVATIRVASDSTLIATWPSDPKPNGGVCSMPFTVTDAQGRRGTGQLTLEVRGFPDAPASLTTVDYSGTSVTLDVALGSAAQAQPALTGVVIVENGSTRSASCAPTGATAYRCVVDGLVNGERHTYTARAVNAVGESEDTAGHTTWAYLAPSIGAPTATPVRVDGRTSVSVGVVQLSIVSGDDVQSFRVVDSGVTITRTGSTTTAQLDLPAGATSTIRLIPLSRFSPPITTGAPTENASPPVSVLVAGLPYFSGAGTVTTSADGTSATLDVPPMSVNGSVETATVRYVASQSDTVVCLEDGAGHAGSTGGTAVQTSTTSTISGLTPNTPYWFTVCGANGFGPAGSGSVAAFTFVDPSSPAGATYSIDPTPSGGAEWQWNTVSVSGIAPPAGADVEFTINGVVSPELTSASFTPGSVPSITAKYCRNTILGQFCGADATVSPAGGSAPTTMTVTFPTVCPVVGDATDVAVSGGAAGNADIVVTATDDVVAGTTTYDYSFTWVGAFAALTPPSAHQLICPLP